MRSARGRVVGQVVCSTASFKPRTGSKALQGSSIFPTATTYTDLLVLHIHLGAANSNLVINSYSLRQTTCIVAWRFHGAQECLLYLFGDAASEQAHGILHGGSVTREDDPPIICEAKLFLGQLQELLKDLLPEVCQWHLKLLPISRVHHTVALACHRATVLIRFQSCLPSEVLFSKGNHLLPPLGHLSNPLGTDHGCFLFFWL